MAGRVVWRVELKHVSGSKEHVAFMLGRSGLAALPDPVAMRILPDGAGFALLQLDEAGASIAHTWHPTLAEAKDVAAAAYGVAADEWTLED